MSDSISLITFSFQTDFTSLEKSDDSDSDDKVEGSGKKVKEDKDKDKKDDDSAVIVDIDFKGKGERSGKSRKDRDVSEVENGAKGRGKKVNEEDVEPTKETLRQALRAEVNAAVGAAVSGAAGGETGGGPVTTPVGLDALTAEAGANAGPTFQVGAIPQIGGGDEGPAIGGVPLAASFQDTALGGPAAAASSTRTPQFSILDNDDAGAGGIDIQIGNNAAEPVAGPLARAQAGPGEDGTGVTFSILDETPDNTPAILRNDEPAGIQPQIGGQAEDQGPGFQINAADEADNTPAILRNEEPNPLAPPTTPPAVATDQPAIGEIPNAGDIAVPAPPNILAEDGAAPAVEIAFDSPLADGSIGVVSEPPDFSERFTGPVEVVLDSTAPAQLDIQTATSIPAGPPANAVAPSGLVTPAIAPEPPSLLDEPAADAPAAAAPAPATGEATDTLPAEPVEIPGPAADDNDNAPAAALAAPATAAPTEEIVAAVEAPAAPVVAAPTQDVAAPAEAPAGTPAEAELLAPEAPAAAATLEATDTAPVEPVVVPEPAADDNAAAPAPALAAPADAPEAAPAAAAPTEEVAAPVEAPAAPAEPGRPDLTSAAGQEALESEAVDAFAARQDDSRTTAPAAGSLIDLFVQ